MCIDVKTKRRMTDRYLSRRSFLKLSGLTIASISIQPFLDYLPPDPRNTPVGLGRVTTDMIYIYDQPTFQAKRIGHYHRDRLIPLLEILKLPDAPAHNPIWYRIQKGYVYSAYLQRVEDWHYNYPLYDLPANKVLGEITAPLVQSYYYTRAGIWSRLYRLYYQSTYWITSIKQDTPGFPLYRLTDDWLKVDYYVPSICVRPILPEEYSPITPDVPRDEKRIVVSLAKQTLAAYEGDRLVLQTSIASGKDRAPVKDQNPSTTPIGSFRIRTKMPSRHMGNGYLTDNINAYELPGVPWTMIFHKDGYATHGTYWHNNFGTRMSHGCINMRNEDARWLFRWTDPVFEPEQMVTRGEGTLLQVFED
jgi:hypothetical protein